MPMSSVSAKPRSPVARAESGLVAWLKFPLEFDADALLADVSGIRHDWWISHFNQRDFTGDWAIAPLRGPAGETHPIRMAYSDPTASEWSDTPLLLACPAIRRVLDQLECPIRSTRLMRLGSGAKIHEHTDHELGFEDGEVRLHVPIETSAEVAFWLGGQQIEMRRGELWYLNVNLPHRVTNRSAQHRTHLVIDCKVNDWIGEIFRKTLDEFAQ